MKITRVVPWTVSYPEPNDSGNIRYLTFCSVEADDGTVGWGEAITQFPESTRATARIIEHIGFKAAYMGGHATGMMHYAVPDCGC